MVANLTEVLAEAKGSEEFREMLFVLVQEKQERGFRAFRSAAKRRQNIRIWIERALLVSGLALLVAYGAARLESAFSSRSALHRFAAIAPWSASATDEVGEAVGPSGVDSRLWHEHRVHAYQESLHKPSGAALAVLAISKIGLEVPLLEGTDGLTLNHAVGRISGTARPGGPGNMGIAGHRDGFFRGLKDLALGDRIELRTPAGTDYYDVDQIRVVDPNDVDVLKPRTAPSLTLVTCYPFYFIGSAPQRYIVHASRAGFGPQKYNSTEQGSLTLADTNQEKPQ
jgi:sortase A